MRPGVIEAMWPMTSGSRSPRSRIFEVQIFWNTGPGRFGAAQRTLPGPPQARQWLRGAARGHPARIQLHGGCAPHFRCLGSRNREFQIFWNSRNRRNSRKRPQTRNPPGRFFSSSSMSRIHSCQRRVQKYRGAHGPVVPWQVRENGPARSRFWFRKSDIHCY